MKGGSVNTEAVGIRRNIERDNHVTEGLRADGWRVIRVWETDLTADLDGVVDRLERMVRDRAI